jgi:Domain of unknown function (DUF222)
VGWQPGRDGEAGAESAPGFGLPDGEWAACPPSASLAALLETVSGTQWRCPGATRDAMFGLLRRWQDIESWAAAGKLGVLRALIRDDDQPLPGGGYHGDLPEGWTKSLTHEVALALSMPAVSAEKLMWIAWDLQARLSGTDALLAAGDLTYPKAKAVCEAFQLLSDEDTAKAEAMILPELPGKTYGQVQKLADQAAVTVDPGSATRRREDAERNQCRVQLFREQSGAAALSGRDLPTDQTLAAHASVCARAQEYKDSGAFPKDTRMDQFRAAAYLDLLNGTTAPTRIAAGQVAGATHTGIVGATGMTGTDGTGQRSGPADPAVDGRECPCRECDGRCLPVDDDDPRDGDPSRDDPGDDHPHDDDLSDDHPGDDDLGDDKASDGDSGTSDSGSNEPGSGDPGDGESGGPGDIGPGDIGPGGAGPDGMGPGGAGPGGAGPGGGSPASPEGGCSGPALPPRLADLVLPLTTLLGLAERPGEGHGLGPLDPGLCRELAAAAIGSPWTQLCVTVTDANGIAIGHGCARPPGRPKSRSSTTANRAQAPILVSAHGPSPVSHAAPSLPARVNLTIATAHLTELAAAGPPGILATPHPPGPPPWSFTRTDNPGPPGGYGSWTLVLPDGGNFTVNLAPVPTLVCDHRHESHAYQPNDTLRHLVQVRDYECTFPPCSRHARESDFEHGVPYDKGGRTCGCNAGARSRACHQVKQSPGWTVSQPRPGWHQWETPTGRIYTQGPKRYPV